AGQGDDYVSPPVLPVVLRRDRYRLGASEDEVPEKERHHRQDDREERVNVLERIPCEPAELLRGRIALLERRISVCILVSNHREEQYGRNQDESLYLVHRWEVEIARAGAFRARPDGRSGAGEASGIQPKLRRSQS